jgi:hypothetical protein
MWIIFLVHVDRSSSTGAHILQFGMDLGPSTSGSSSNLGWLTLQAQARILLVQVAQPPSTDCRILLVNVVSLFTSSQILARVLGRRDSVRFVSTPDCCLQPRYQLVMHTG